jgi:hypothetical protein
VPGSSGIQGGAPSTVQQTVEEHPKQAWIKNLTPQFCLLLWLLPHFAVCLQSALFHGNCDASNVCDHFEHVSQLTIFMDDDKTRTRQLFRFEIYPLWLFFAHTLSPSDLVLFVNFYLITRTLSYWLEIIFFVFPCCKTSY